LLRLCVLLRFGVVTRLGHREGPEAANHKHTGDTGGDQASTKALKRLSYFAHSALRPNSVAP
jgi:hypothetical protein